MQTLTEADVISWLSVRGIQQAPYDMSGYFSGVDYRQMRIPAPASQRWAFATAVVKGCGRFKEALLHFTDWAHYTPEQMAIITAVLSGSGESRPLIEVPGQTFGPGDAELLSGLLGLAMTFEWCAYLYVKDGPTFLVWDGVLLDIWVPRWRRRRLYRSLDLFLETDEQT